MNNRQKETEFFRNCPQCNLVLFYSRRDGLNLAIKNNTLCFECSNHNRSVKLVEINGGSYDKNINKWIRKCPQCKNNIIYKSSTTIMTALKEQKICLKCNAKNINKPFIKYNYDAHFDNEFNKYFYYCNECSIKLYVAGKRGLRKALSTNSRCRDCANNDPKLKEQISIKIKEVYNNPNSKFNTPEFIETRNERCSKFITKYNLSDQNPSYKEENKIKSAIKLKEMREDENSNYNKAINSIEYCNNRSLVMKLAWKNPNSKFNDPKFKKEAGERLRKNAMKKGNNISRGEIKLYEAIKHLGFLHNKFDIRIENFYPDIIHNKYKLLIEYNGDLYHANPNKEKYKNDDAVITFPDGRTKLAKEIREYDAQRQKKLVDAGYVVYIVWESDFKTKYGYKKIIEEISALTNKY